MKQLPLAKKKKLLKTVGIGALGKHGAPKQHLHKNHTPKSVRQRDFRERYGTL